MNSLVIFLFETSLSLSILLLAYLCIRRSLSFQVRRFTLMLLPILSTAIYFIGNWNWAGVEPKLGGIRVELLPINIQGSMEVESGLNLHWIYIIGVIVFLLLLEFRLHKVVHIFRGKGWYKYRDCKVYTSDDSDSFSFFNRIHLSSRLKSGERQVVLHHEYLHAQKKHSIDLLILEFIHAMYWFNPLIIWLKKELVAVHEFEVDEEMYAEHQSNYLDQLLSQSLGSMYAKQLLASKFFNKLTLSKRIKTMKTMKKRNHKTLLVLPVFMLALVLMSWDGASVANKMIDLSSFSKLSVESNGSSQSKPDKQAQFKGGQKALMEYMQENIKYPKGVEASGKVMVQFMVDTKGQVKKVKVTKSVHPKLDEEALRVIKSMPNWIPGEKDGKKVNTTLALPIQFVYK